MSLKHRIVVRIHEEQPITLYPIAGVTSSEKSVSLWHTNEYLRNFHWTLEEDVRRIYDSWPDGKYAFMAGYQNGYHEIGVSYVTVETNGAVAKRLMRGTANP